MHIFAIVLASKFDINTLITIFISNTKITISLGFEFKQLVVIARITPLVNVTAITLGK